MATILRVDANCGFDVKKILTVEEAYWAEKRKLYRREVYKRSGVAIVIADARQLFWHNS